MSGRYEQSRREQADNMPNRDSLERISSQTINLALLLDKDGSEMRENLFGINDRLSIVGTDERDLLRSEALSALYNLLNLALNVFDEEYLFLSPVESSSLIHGRKVGRDVQNEVVDRIVDRFLRGEENHVPENTLTIGKLKEDPETLLIREVYTRTVPIQINGEQRVGEVNEYRTYALNGNRIDRLGVSWFDLHYHDRVETPTGEVHLRHNIPLSPQEIYSYFNNEPPEPKEVTFDEVAILFHHVTENIIEAVARNASRKPIEATM